jgi:hypothetical protein
MEDTAMRPHFTPVTSDSWFFATYKNLLVRVCPQEHGRRTAQLLVAELNGSHRPKGRPAVYVNLEKQAFCARFNRSQVIRLGATAVLSLADAVERLQEHLLRLNATGALIETLSQYAEHFGQDLVKRVTLQFCEKL